MTEYTVKIGGTELPFISFNYIRDIRPQPMPGELVLAGVNHPVKVLSTIDIYRDNDLVYRGIVEKMEKKLSPQEGFITRLYFRDVKVNLALQKVEVAQYVNVEATTQVKDIIRNTGLIERSFDATGMLITTDLSNKNKTDALKTIIEMTGWDFLVEPDGRCDWKAKAGRDLSASVVFNEKTNIVSLPVPLTSEPVSWVEDALRQCKKVWIVGKGTGAKKVVASAQTPDFVPGTRECTFSMKDIPNVAEATKVAETILEVLQNPVRIGELVVLDNAGGRSFDLFDTVRVEIPTLGVAGNYRIMRLERRFDINLGEEVRLRVTDIPKLAYVDLLGARSIEDVLADLAESLDDLEEPEQIIEDSGPGGSSFGSSSGVGNIGGGSGVGNVSGGSGVDNINALSGVRNLGSRTGVGNLDSYTSVSSGSSATGLVNLTTGDHQHSLGGTTSSEAPSHYHSVTVGNTTYTTTIASVLHSHDLPTGVSLSGSHTHGHGSDSHSHPTNNPSHGHGHSEEDHSHSHDDPGHNHGHSDPGHNHAHNDPGHNHGHSDPTHAHVNPGDLYRHKH